MCLRGLPSPLCLAMHDDTEFLIWEPASLTNQEEAALMATCSFLYSQHRGASHEPATVLSHLLHYPVGSIQMVRNCCVTISDLAG